MTEHTPTSPNLPKPFKMILGLISVLIVIISIIWLIFDPGFEPLINVLMAIPPILVSFAAYSTFIKNAPISKKKQSENRQKMLQLVQEFWVGGVLKPTLAEQEAFKIDLKATMPHLTLKQDERTEVALPSGVKIDEIFYDIAACNLLILGDPGSGKTILLLQLAEKLIQRAQMDESYQIPVVFNLSSWAEKRQPLQEWLKEELITRYKIPKKVAVTFVDNEKLLLLLDGLDEVAKDHRNACVGVINSFRDVYTSVKMVVCSRIADYEEIEGRLNLRVAIIVQPLTEEQIAPYLEGEHIAGLREILAQDSTLQIMTTTPFLLNTMVYAYRGESALNLQLAQNDEKSRRNHLFEKYVNHRLIATSQIPSTPPYKTRHYLAWLAGNMEKEKESIFFIEDLQFSWMKQSYQNNFHLKVFLFVCTITLILCLIGGVAIGLVLQNFMFSVGFSVIIGIFLGIALGGISLILIADLSINVVESFKFNLSIKMFAVGLLISLPFTFIMLLVSNLINVDLGGIAFWFPIILTMSLLLALVETTIVKFRRYPNQGIKKSIVNSLRAALMAGIVSFTFTDLRGAFLLSFIFFLNFGFDPVYKHAILRQVLYRTGDAPLNYAKFLDYAAERMILRKVGGGYIFIHRYLLEYFASLEKKSNPNPSP